MSNPKLAKPMSQKVASPRPTQNNQTPQTEFVEGEGLKIPVFDMSMAKTVGYQKQPETKRNTIVELLFTPEELKSLVIVKPDPQNDSIDPLKNLDFGDGIPRIAAFSSGSNIYYADRELAKKLIEPFRTQPDHACRYGSLLVSSCNQGATMLDAEDDGKPLRIKIVNSQSKDEAERQLAAQFSTGDCHGKISPQLAKMLGGKNNCPFQFRLAWLQEWGDKQHDSPSTSFLAKGTFLPDAKLTVDQGYDLILDQSSIKGIAKDQIDTLIPCGDYELPKVILGNRGNAQTQTYENSWQLSIWYSQEAIKHDIVQPTHTEAKKLAALQQNPLQLAHYLVDKYDRKQQFSNHGDEDILIGDELSSQEQRSESRLISLLRNDKYGQLLDHPKVADFMRSQLANQWRDLAIKGAIQHGSAMAQPCDELKSGTIVAPHLPHGTEVIVTRYPIVSKDNIRRYTVDNQQKPELLKYTGCAFIRPDQAMEHHQCDFDGDQLVITPASRLPHIAAETRHANESREYDEVAKRPKIDYTDAVDSKGKRKYTKLRQIAVAVPQNSIGYIATLIGRVQSSVPQIDEPQGLFEHKQRKLLGKLFDALQIEVDSPKSATRFTDHHSKLGEQTKKWVEKYPSHLFDYKKDERLYKSMPLPTEGDNPINVIARDAVNPEWEPTRLRSRHRHEFRYLLSPPTQKKMKQVWEEHYLPWAQELKQSFIETSKEIHKTKDGDIQAIKEAYGKLYEDLRGEINDGFTTDQEKQLAASALWHVETTNPNLHEPRAACAALSSKLKIEFNLEEAHQLRHQAIPKDTYILSVPFQDKQGKDLAERWNEALSRKGVEFEATVHPSLPMVDFALVDPSDQLVELLDDKYGDNNNHHLQKSDLTYQNRQGQTRRISDRIVPPVSYQRWLSNEEDITPKSTLALNLFAEQLCEQLQDYHFEKLQLIGMKHNELAHINFSDPRFTDKKLQFAVEALHAPDTHLHGTPVVTLKDKTLAVFSPNSPKLPIGSKFKATIEPEGTGSALTLHLDSESIQVRDEGGVFGTRGTRGTGESFEGGGMRDEDGRMRGTRGTRRTRETRETRETRGTRESFEGGGMRDEGGVFGTRETGETRGTRRMEEDESQAIQKRQSTRGKLNLTLGSLSEHHSPSPVKPSQNDSRDSSTQEVSKVLHDALTQKYQEAQATKINLGSWTAFVSSRNHDCFVRDQTRQVIFSSNLQTGEIKMPLSEENSQTFVAQIQQIDQKLSSPRQPQSNSQLQA